MSAEYPITVRAIVQAVSRARRIPERAILSNSQNREITDARLMVYWLARSLPGLSSGLIGRVLGRDHSTVLVGAAVVERRRLEEPDLAAELAALFEELKVTAQLHRARMLADPDPIGAAERITLSPDPIREGLRATALEVASMAARAVDLENVAAALAQIAARFDLVGAVAHAAGSDNDPAASLMRAITETLEDLGYSLQPTDQPQQQEETANAG